MNSRFRKLAVESLEGRSVLSTMVEYDFNGDGLKDIAAITDQGTIAVSLDNGNGGYDVSDILTAPKNQAIVDIYFVEDGENDGDWDLYTIASNPSGNTQLVSFRNNGDGTFEYVEPFKWKGRPIRWF